jgi:molybdenum cofactor guanylyltransferase
LRSWSKIGGDLGVVVQFSIAILAGGQSRRMGQDKAFLDVGGKSVLQRALEQVASLTDDLFLVSNSHPVYQAFGQRMVADIFPGKAALGGIYTALRAARYEYVFVAACDMPFLDARLVSHLATLAPGYDVVVPRLHAQPETLHALYGKTCLPAIEKRLAADRLKVLGFFEDVKVRFVERDDIAQFDPRFLSFANMNTPAEWAELQRLAAQLDIDT